jgi:hypothetical protein
MDKTVVYGIGGYDPSKPNNNIVEEYEEEYSDATESLELVRETALEKLRNIGLTDEEINAILGGVQ